MDNRDAPATKGDFADLKTEVAEIKGDLEDFRVEVNTRFEQFEHRMESLLEEMQGHILTSIYRLAESSQQRLTQAESNQSSFNVRLATLEQRLTDLEKRIDMPPQRTQ